MRGKRVPTQCAKNDNKMTIQYLSFIRLATKCNVQLVVPRVPAIATGCTGRSWDLKLIN